MFVLFTGHHTQSYMVAILPLYLIHQLITQNCNSTQILPSASYISFAVENICPPVTIILLILFLISTILPLTHFSCLHGLDRVYWGRFSMDGHPSCSQSLTTSNNVIFPNGRYVFAEYWKRVTFTVVMLLSRLGNNNTHIRI